MIREKGTDIECVVVTADEFELRSPITDGSDHDTEQDRSGCRRW